MKTNHQGSFNFINKCFHTLMSEELVKAFKKDLLTYSKSDLIVMARYYSIPTNHIKAELAKLLAEKVVDGIDIGNMITGNECGAKVSSIQTELYSKLNELREAQDKLNGQIEMGKMNMDGDFEKIIPQLFSECETELEQIKKCVDSNVDSAKKNIQDKINLIDQYIKQKQQQHIFDDAIIVERPILLDEPLIQHEEPSPKPSPGLFPNPIKTNATDDQKLLDAMSDDEENERLVNEINAMLSDDEEDDDEKLLAELEAKLCEKDEDCPRKNGQKVICVTKNSNGKTACISENCIIEP